MSRKPFKISTMDKYDEKRDFAVYMKTFIMTMVLLKLRDEAVMQLFPRPLGDVTTKLAGTSSLLLTNCLNSLSDIFLDIF